MPSRLFIAFGYCDEVEPPVAPTVTSRYGPPASAGIRAGSGATNGGHVRRTVELDDELDIPDFLKG